MDAYRWTHEDFPAMSWHDNALHGIRIGEGRDGSGELELDLDFILERLRADDGYQFRMIPATLRFLDVSNLRVLIDYARMGTTLHPLILHAIEQPGPSGEGNGRQMWEILMSFPEAEITFEATGFEQVGRGEPVVTGAQRLTPEQRGDR